MTQPQPPSSSPSSSSPSPSRVLWRLARLLLPAALLVFLFLWLRRMDLGRVWATLRAARPDLFAAAVALNLLPNTIARVQRWRTLLRPLPLPAGARRAGFGELLALFFASTAANNVLPARPGEALRAVRLHRQHGYSVGALVASQVLERLIETASLGLLALPVVGLSATPRGVAVPLVLLALVAVGAVAVGLVVARRAHRGLAHEDRNDGAENDGARNDGATDVRTSSGRLRRAVRAFLARVTEAMRLMGTPRTLLASLGWSWVSDLADVAMVGLCLAAVHQSLPVAAWLLVFVAINLAIVVPATPGQLGVFEASAVVVLTLLGVDGGAALSFAVLYHAAHLIPTTLLGVVFYFRGRLSPSPSVSVSVDSHSGGPR